MNLEGQQLGEFEILERLGQGGMGAVYKARQISLNRLVALKTLQSSLAEDQEYIVRFQQEARAAAGLTHPNLVQVFSAGETNRLHWFAMEYVDGESAKARLKRNGRIDPLETIAIAVHVAAALEYGWRKAHLVHRDIKPDNIFLSSDGEVKLGDLGLAKSVDQTKRLTMTGHAMGSPYYISPEQVQDMKDVDFRADIYSLGCTLYHLVSGVPPFEGSSAAAVMFKHVHNPVPELRGDWPECPQALNDVVGKMMQKEPEKRQQDYAEVIGHLRHAYDVVSDQDAPTPATESRKPVVLETTRSASASKSRWPLAVGIVAAVIVISGVSFSRFPPKGGQLQTKLLHAGEPSASGSPSIKWTAAPPVKTYDTKSEQMPRTEASMATKEAPYINTLGMKFVPVPGTTVLMCIHETRRRDYAAYARENEAVDDSWMHAERDGVPVGAEDDHPAVMVNWYDAQAFCSWLSAREGRSYRLPTDREWSYAIGIGSREPIGLTPEALSQAINDEYLWGHEWPPPKGAGNFPDRATKMAIPNQAIIPSYDDGFATTAPVMSFPASRLGLYDLAGNVWEWCYDWVNEKHAERVLRGGAWNTDVPGHLLASFRYRRPPQTRENYFGFRCVLSLSASPDTTQP